MRTPFRAALSRLVGWIADRRIPAPLRAGVFRTYARATGADLSEVRDPLPAHATLGEFFVRQLKSDARPIDGRAESLISPCDGTLQAEGRVERGSLLQAKGRSYALADLLGSEADARECEGGHAWTIYLSPRDYHRVHTPEQCTLAEVRRIPGARFSVAPGVLARRLVLPINDRAVLRLDTERGVLFLVMVGATNVGRIRVLGESARRRFRRGEEMARFEMGSTVVLVAPAGAVTPAAELRPGSHIRLGEPLASWARVAGAVQA